MGQSIVVKDMSKCCVFGCEHTPVEIHHAISGTANRAMSDKFKLIVPMCHEHHMELHNDPKMEKYYQRLAQNAFEQQIGTRAQFIAIFGKSYF